MAVNDIIKRMLLLRGNETSTLNIHSKMKFNEILLDLVAIENNIRWCSNHRCVCHPETTINTLIQDDEISTFLKEENLWDEINEIVNKEYEPITVFDTGLIG